MEEKKICNGCAEQENCDTEIIQDTERDPIPFWIYQETRARDARTINALRKSLIISIIAGAILALGIHVGWLVYESMFDTISYDQAGGGINNVNLGKQGALYGAEGETEIEEKAK